MNADSHFIIGDSHEICEDYTLVEKIKGDDCIQIVLSDGCSSSPDTDVGSRILARSFINHNFSPLKIECLKIIGKTNDIICSLKLNPLCLDVTIITAIAEENSISTFIYGDGTIVLRNKRSQVLEIYDYEFESGAPYYLNYNLDFDRDKSYFKTFPGKLIVEEPGIIHVSNPVSMPYVLHIKNKYTYDLVAIFSDGIKSFQYSDGESIDYKLIIEELTAFKSYKGSFVKRRIKRALKELKEKGSIHYDDISMAAIYWG